MTGSTGSKAGMTDEIKEKVNNDAGINNAETGAAVSGSSDAFAGEGLAPEHISRLLDMLGEDTINDLLASAGLAEEDLQDAAAAPDGSGSSVSSDGSIATEDNSGEIIDAADPAAAAENPEDAADTAESTAAAESPEDAGDTAESTAAAEKSEDAGDTASADAAAENPEQAGDTAGSDAAAEKSEDAGDTAGSDATAEAPEVAGHTAGAVAMTGAAASGDLEPEHIGHLLKWLGEDVINEMLEDAGLAEKDAAENAAEDGDTGSPESGEDDISASKSRRKRRRRTKERFLLLAIVAGIVLLVFAVNQISMNVTLNSDDPIQYSEQVDDISALEGALIVNDVKVSVPTNGSEEYSISYSWAEDDDKYPSVPQAITAVYSDKEGEKLFTISLYRSETTKKKELPKGKKADNWFDDWEAVSEGDVLQKPLKSGDISGFYIYPLMNEEGTGPTTDYNDYSYYFAVKDRGGVSVYILEGVCLNESVAGRFPETMDKCINSIKIMKDKQDKDAKSDNDGQSDPDVQPDADTETQQA